MHQASIQKMHGRCRCPTEVTEIVLLDSDISLIGEEIEQLGSCQSAFEKLLGGSDTLGAQYPFWGSGCLSLWGVGEMAIQFCPGGISQHQGFEDELVVTQLALKFFSVMVERPPWPWQHPCSEVGGRSASPAKPPS